MTDTAAIPTTTTDPINHKILEISEDSIQGFSEDPIGLIAERTGFAVDLIIDRIRAMLRAGTIRRVRQTLMSVNLAPGALVAWSIPEDKLQSGFDYLFQKDPFSGHVVIRSTDAGISATRYRLWTTLKVPVGYSMEKHCEWLRQQIGANSFKMMSAVKLFVLGVGHVRRRGLDVGSKAEVAAEAHDTELVTLSDLEWQVLMPLKREFEPDEIVRDLWAARAKEAGVSKDEFCRVARALNDRGVVGRFSTFLEHVKTTKDGEKVTKFNALFHWAVPEGMQLRAGGEVGRFHCMTHAYWREGGPEFAHVNIMGVAHGTQKDVVLANKKAIDDHLNSIGIPVKYTNVFWGGRSEIKPSEIAPAEYVAFCKSVGLDPEKMRE